jgi:hypothetical protein
LSGWGQKNVSSVSCLVTVSRVLTKDLSAKAEDGGFFDLSGHGCCVWKLWLEIDVECDEGGWKFKLTVEGFRRCK